MHPRNSLLLSVALCALGAGCVGTGPNTQEGAVAGGALGALAGAILGNNSSSHNSLAGAAIGAAAGAIAGGTLGNAQDNQQGTLYGPSQGVAYRGTDQQQVAIGPPQPPTSSPADVVTPSPSPSAVWIPGYWAYNGSGYVWTAGHWEIPPPNSHAYIAPHWELQGNSYLYYQGYWR
jgi:YMGG-like Gly-zipper/WXXGXW repeat (2 copies)